VKTQTVESLSVGVFPTGDGTGILEHPIMCNSLFFILALKWRFLI
jgi:hypothetical protein